VRAFDRKIAESTIPNMYVRIVINTLEEGGDSDTLQLLEQECPWITTSIQNNTDINAIQFIHLAQLLSEQSFNPNLGLEIGRNLPPHSHGLLGMLLISAPTLQIAMENLVEFYSICVPFVKASAEVEGHDFITKISSNIPVPEDAFQFLLDVMYGTFDELIRFFTGKNKNISSISLTATSQPNANYQQLLGTDVHLGQPEYRAVIPLKIAQLTSPLACQELYKEYVQKCLNRTISTGQRQTYTTKIKDIINKDIAYNWTLEGIAEQLCLSVSTLQRKLNNENICFREIMSTIKFSLAKNKLTTTIETIDDIAHSLGYSDASNFCAAFKRIEDISPSKYREKVKKGLQQNT